MESFPQQIATAMRREWGGNALSAKRGRTDYERQ